MGNDHRAGINADRGLESGVEDGRKDSAGGLTIGLMFGTNWFQIFCRLGYCHDLFEVGGSWFAVWRGGNGFLPRVGAFLFWKFC